jgi:hypothetical protein
VTDACTVIIGASDLLPTLRKRAVPDNGEVLMFTELESIGALQAITRRRPQVVAFERLFAMTSRGAALINRIKADPTLRASEIRVIAHNSDYSRVVPRAAVPAPPALGPSHAFPQSADPGLPPEVAKIGLCSAKLFNLPLELSQPLQCGFALLNKDPRCSDSFAPLATVA